MGDFDGQFSPRHSLGKDIPLHLSQVLEPEVIQKAMRLVASNSQSIDDCRLLLEVLGLLEDKEKEAG